MPTTPRVHEFEVAVDRTGTARSGLDGAAIPPDDAWWAEHLVLAGLVRCTLTSLAHAARRAALEVTAEGRAHGTVTKRDEDGLYALVEVESSFDVEVSPMPEREALVELLDWTERGCFVGNSLKARPTYRWTVNGEEVR
ncbi:MAG: OsmC family protein [Gaiellaceae bacterium]